MGCKHFWKKLVSFALAFLLGLMAASLSHSENSAPVSPEKIKPPDKTISWRDEEGTGASGIGSKSSDEKTVSRPGTSKPLILSKPRPDYTTAGRENGTQGVVRLRVVFLASGKIGAINAVNGTLPDGLTEQAIAAARKIKFKPATYKGVPVNVAGIVEYSFTIY